MGAYLFIFEQLSNFFPYCQSSHESNLFWYFENNAYLVVCNEFCVFLHDSSNNVPVAKSVVWNFYIQND